MKKALIYSGIAIVALVILYFVFKPKAKKPCGCQNSDPAAAIAQMTDQELKDQIYVFDKSIATQGKTRDELVILLTGLINKK